MKLANVHQQQTLTMKKQSHHKYSIQFDKVYAVNVYSSSSLKISSVLRNTFHQCDDSFSVSLCPGRSHSPKTTNIVTQQTMNGHEIVQRHNINQTIYSLIHRGGSTLGQEGARAPRFTCYPRFKS